MASRRAARRALLAVTTALGLLTLWCAVAPLAEGVPASGLVVVESKRKAVQHLLGGRVKRALVAEGDMVTLGQPLLELDERIALSTLETARQEYFALLTTRDRLLAERSGRRSVEFSPEVKEGAGAFPQVRAMQASQLALIRARNLALEARVSALDKRMAAERAKLAGFRQAAARLALDHAAVARQLDDIRPLVGEGYAPRSQQVELERELARVANQRTETVANAEVNLDTLAELESEKRALHQERLQEVEASLSEVIEKLQGAEARFIAAGAELDSMVVRAPLAGQVVGLVTQAAGAVIQAGERILDVVPTGAAVVVEARVPPHLVDRLRVGQEADLRFSAFAHSPLLVVQGRLDNLSADVLIDQQHGQPYYLARVSLSESGRALLDDRLLKPGMPVEVMFLTGSRTVLNYILHPLVRRFSAAMTEE